MYHHAETETSEAAAEAAFRRLWPDTAEMAGGRLRLGGCDVEALAREWGTPLYVLDEATFRGAGRAYAAALARCYPGAGAVHYAAKALFNTTVARWVREEGLSLDAASAGEVFTALRGGLAAERIHLHGNAKPRDELEYALAVGVGAIVTDTLDELALIETLGAAAGRPVDVILRIAPGVGADTHPHIQTGLDTAKFGLLAAQLPRAARLIEEGRHVRLAGLHCHIGSQIFDLDAWAEAIEALLDARALMGRELGRLSGDLSPGGGLGVPYAPGDPAVEIAAFVERVAAATVAGCAARAMPLPRLFLEPGRSIAARAGVAAYRIVARKDLEAAAGEAGGPRCWLHLDGGMADNLRPALYGARYEAALAARMDDARTERVSLAGRYCESSDVLVADVALPPAGPGELVVMPGCGAYTLAMASNYNLSRRPAVIAVKDGAARLVQRRETFDDLVARDEPGAGEGILLSSPFGGSTGEAGEGGT